VNELLAKKKLTEEKVKRMQDEKIAEIHRNIKSSGKSPPFVKSKLKKTPITAKKTDEN
jgi:hypothetical protein